MNRTIFLKHLFLWGLLIPSLCACGGMDETYKEFIENGEIVYPGRADSVKLRPGYLRVEAKWELISDPTITRCQLVVDGREQIDIPFDWSAGSGVVTRIVENLSEGSHVFDIYTFDAEGNRSVGVEAVGFAYGPNYTESLYNRSIQHIAFDSQTSEVTLEWKMSPESSIGTEISYTDVEGMSRQEMLLPEENTVVLEKVEPGTEIRYQTVFMPDEEAIDSFRAAVSTVTVPADE